MATTRKTAKKTAAKRSTQQPPRPLVPQPHGGALQPGAGGGNNGGGRPPSILRNRLRMGYGKRIAFLNRVIDGEVMQRAEIPLLAVLPHVTCPNCGEGAQEPKDGVASLLTVTFEAKVSASVKDRIAALDHQAKYGLGALKEVSVENVKERVQDTLTIIRDHCTAEQREAIYAAMEPVWR